VAARRNLPRLVGEEVVIVAVPGYHVVGQRVRVCDAFKVSLFALVDVDWLANFRYGRGICGRRLGVITPVHPAG
jgi:hypothetical protein